MVCKLYLNKDALKSSCLMKQLCINERIRWDLHRALSEEWAGPLEDEEGSALGAWRAGAGPRALYTAHFWMCVSTVESSDADLGARVIHWRAPKQWGIEDELSGGHSLRAGGAGGLAAMVLCTILAHQRITLLTGKITQGGICSLLQKRQVGRRGDRCVCEGSLHYTLYFWSGL